MFVDPSMISMLAELRIPGEPDPVEEILGVFENDAVEVMRWIADAHAARDAEALRRASHRLKGAAANVGAAELAQALARVEQAARAGDIDAATADVARLPELFRESLTALQALR